MAITFALVLRFDIRVVDKGCNEYNIILIVYYKYKALFIVYFTSRYRRKRIGPFSVVIAFIPRRVFQSILAPLGYLEDWLSRNPGTPCCTLVCVCVFPSLLPCAEQVSHPL